MSIQDRLKMIMKMNNLNASSFADKVGVQRSSVSHILSGRNKPSLDFIQKTLSTFPRVSGDWLVSGKQPTIEVSGITTPPVQMEEKKSATVTTGVEADVNTTQKNTASNKTVEKIVYFYTDGTFKEFTPSNEE
ncbi:DNA-binding transcriptional regulator, XRE-family HTH domain [Lishizhenia tianjinensis]|uniref:DNA-binding transcriptional regulator, XRE-family HTH domain n=1 Tax=Lishizhenia tianjinensis TaxID=477690 RepID=A0A1I6Y261_9FLAO|nr:helix-turn-helix transcriptional regulator [Lishizhenia tianjinensis]SFT44204.1 DNA-binding transcriptional regulator, XRE-family HTH domain [Lishizhenia tianjinensis]